MTRDYTFIDDIVAGVLAAADRCEVYRIYNLGNSNPIGLTDLIEALEAALGKKALVDCHRSQASDVERTFADITLARSKLGYNPATDMQTGLARFVEWLRDGPPSSTPEAAEVCCV
jgi:UDP-glucuronate 4-epimerase